MALGRLELGEVERTSYNDPRGEGGEVQITFRHPTSGEVARSYGDVGLDIKDDGSVIAHGEECSKFEIGARLEDADEALAHMCVLGCSVSLDELYRPAVILLGKYLRKQAEASAEEKKD